MQPGPSACDLPVSPQHISASAHVISPMRTNGPHLPVLAAPGDAHKTTPPRPLSPSPPAFPTPGTHVPGHEFRTAPCASKHQHPCRSKSQLARSVSPVPAALSCPPPLPQYGLGKPAQLTSSTCMPSSTQLHARPTASHPVRGYDIQPAQQPCPAPPNSCTPHMCVHPPHVRPSCTRLPRDVPPRCATHGRTALLRWRCRPLGRTERRKGGADEGNRRARSGRPGGRQQGRVLVSVLRVSVGW